MVSSFHVSSLFFGFLSFHFAVNIIVNVVVILKEKLENDFNFNLERYIQNRISMHWLCSVRTMRSHTHKWLIKELILSTMSCCLHSLLSSLFFIFFISIFRVCLNTCSHISMECFKQYQIGKNPEILSIFTLHSLQKNIFCYCVFAC